MERGPVNLVVRAVGYRPYVRTFQLDRPTDLEITLQEESYQIDAVQITQKEDPAYEMIRNAIARRDYHLHEIPPHQVRVYIKGLQRLKEAPERFLGIDLNQVGSELGLDSNRRGILYLSESESVLTVDPPSRFREEMVSSKVAGSNRAFSFNRASDLQFNLYKNHDALVEGLSSRPFISPIADQALRYYNYRYIGFSEEEDQTIFKIQVLPKRRGEPLYAGFIYLIDGDWRLYSIDLTLNAQSSLRIVDSIRIRQNFIPHPQGLWLPSGTQLDFHAGLFGFKISGHFSAVFSGYDLQTHIEKRRFLESLKINPDVQAKNTLYWEQNRPLPLTAEEQRDYRLKDSLRQRRESPEYLDSLDRRFNTFGPGNLVTGYTYRNRAERYTITTSGLPSTLSYNAQEGAVIRASTLFRKNLDTLNQRAYSVGLVLRYGFSSKRLDPALTLAYQPNSRDRLSFSGGADVRDLNSHADFPVWLNTIYNLCCGEDVIHWYHRYYANVAWDFTSPGNIRFKTSLDWEQRNWFQQTEQVTSMSLTATHDFSYRYESYPWGRRYLPSKFPTLSIHFRQGIPQLGKADYTFLSAALYKENVPLGTLGKFDFHAEVGGFLGNKSPSYPDFKHFSGARTTITPRKQNTFLLLDPYLWSTAGKFAEGHFTYNFSEIITSKIPYLRRLRLQELVGLHFLKTSELENYTEIHAGLEWRNFGVFYVRQLTGTHGEGLRITFRL